MANCTNRKCKPLWEVKTVVKMSEKQLTKIQTKLLETSCEQYQKQIDVIILLMWFQYVKINGNFNTCESEMHKNLLPVQNYKLMF